MSLFCAYKQESVVKLFVLIETYPVQLDRIFTLYKIYENQAYDSVWRNWQKFGQINESETSAVCFPLGKISDGGTD